MSGPGEEKRRRQVEQLCRFAGSLGATMDVALLVEDCLEPLLALSEAGGVMIALSLSEPKTLEPMAEQRICFNGKGRGLPASTIASMGTEARAFARAGDLPDPLNSRLSGLGDGEVVVVPLWVHARLLGALVLACDGRPCDVTTLKLLTTAGRQLSLAIENSLVLSEMQRSYGRLLDNQEELIRSERLAAMGQLSATMAHEIRNPLATIFSAVSQIRKHSTLDQISKQLLDITEEEALRMNRLIAGLLEFARPRKPVFETARPRAVVAEAVNSFLKANNVAEGMVRFETCETGDLEAIFDADLLQRAVSLLLTNGLQAVEERDGKVRVGVERVPDGRRGFAVVVSDNGCGIPKEHLHRVFEPFYSTRPSGIGLSLSTAMRIAEDHGGTIEILTEVGTGTTVHLLIPYRPAAVMMEDDQ